MLNENLIYDVGAHKGEDTLFYLQKGFTVVAIEAIPDFCDALNEKFSKYVKDGQLKLLNVAVSDAPSPIDFYVDEQVSVWGTANREWVERNASLGAGKTKKISVDARPLADIVDEYGVPWYCKIDIEGNDLDALKSLGGAPQAPRYVSIESEKRDWSRLMDEFTTFRRLGYSRYKIIDQSLVDLQIVPRPAREGLECEHGFEVGSSGLFGDELPGAWLDLTEAVEAYRHIFRGYALNGDNGMFRGRISLFHALGKAQAKIAKLRRHTGYLNPADILPPVAWYDTHAGL